LDRASPPRPPTARPGAAGSMRSPYSPRSGAFSSHEGVLRMSLRAPGSRPAGRDAATGKRRTPQDGERLRRRGLSDWNRHRSARAVRWAVGIAIVAFVLGGARNVSPIEALYGMPATA